MATPKLPPKPNKVCRFCNKLYTPKLHAKPERNWCSEYNCESKRELEITDRINDRQKRERLARGTTAT